MAKKKSSRQTGPSIDAIRAAVRQYHGGFDSASDQAILNLWNTFSPLRQKRYLEAEIAGGRPAAVAEAMAGPVSAEKPDDKPPYGGEPQASEAPAEGGPTDRPLDGKDDETDADTN